MLEPQLEALLRALGTIRLRRIRMPGRSTPVAAQFGIRRVPTLHLYDGFELIEDDAQRVLEILQQQ